MPSAAKARPIDPAFDPPPQFPALERRLAGLALDGWRENGGRLPPGFDDHSLVIADPAGRARIATAGAPVTATFGLAPGMALDGRDGLAAEIRAACDLIAIDPRPVPFEASLASPGRACILIRGIALPLDFDRVQVVVNWRELLNRSATTRLRREIGAALRSAAPLGTARDPFASSKSPPPGRG